MFKQALKFMQMVAVGLVQVSCSVMEKESGGGVVCPSARAGDYIATLIQHLEPGMPALHRNPDKDRYRLSLRLDPLDGSAPKFIRLGDGLRASDYTHAARFMGDDGQRIWFHAQEIMAYDHRQHHLIRGSELSRFTEPRQTGLFPRTNPDDFLEKAEKLAGRYTRANTILNAAMGKPLQLTEPDGSLITHRLNPGIDSTIGVIRLNAAGEEVWKTDSGLQNLDQILPDTQTIAFIGLQRPKYKDEVRGPVLVLIDVKTGRTTSTLFWGKSN